MRLVERSRSALLLLLTALALVEVFLPGNVALAERGRRRPSTGSTAAATAQPRTTARPKKPLPWWNESEIEIVHSDLPSLEAAIDAMYTSHRFDFPGPYGQSGMEIADYEWA